MIGDQGAEGDGTLYIIIPAADQLPACLSFKERIISSRKLRGYSTIAERPKP